MLPHLAKSAIRGALAEVGVKVLTFARYCGLLGFSEATLPLPDPPILSELLKQPCFALLPSEALLAVNQKFVGKDAEINHGDEIAVMPPVSGG